MRTIIAAALFGICSAAGAASVTITDQNSSLKLNIDEPNANLNVPNDPVQLPRTVEWTVDGRRILVYPSSPLTFDDVGHMHLGAHVNTNQIHAQGPLLGYGTGAMTGTVTGGVVYTVSGGATSSGTSRISEKVDIHNKSGGPVSVLLAGMGFKPTQQSLEQPDLSGLTVNGTTVVYFQGNPQTGSLTEPPFAPVTVLPAVNFSGFNPLLNQSLNLPDGAMLTMVTELTVQRAPLLSLTTIVIIAVLVLLLGGAGMAYVSRRSRRQ